MIDPVVVRRHELCCQVRSIDTVMSDNPCSLPCSQPCSPPTTSRPHSDSISIDPDNILPEDISKAFTSVHRKYDNLRNQSISKYNGNSEKVECVVIMGPALPPQTKGKVPHYNQSRLVELQKSFTIWKDGVCLPSQKMSMLKWNI